MSVTIMLYGSVKTSIDLRMSEDNLANGTIPMHQFILEDDIGNRVVCNIRGSQFFSLMSELRRVILDACVEREIHERLVKREQANKKPSSARTASELAAMSEDPRMRLTLKDMERQQEKKEGANNAAD